MVWSSVVVTATVALQLEPITIVVSVLEWGRLLIGF